MEDQFKIALEIVGGIVQIAIALSPILLARLRRSRGGEPMVRREEERITPRGQALGVESVAALACGLFVMASVASLLIHVYVTSREGIHPPEAIATSFFISILIGAVTYLAWRWQCMPAVVSATCISTALASALVYQLWMKDYSDAYTLNEGPRYSYLSVLILFVIGIAYFASIVGSPVRFSPLGLRRTNRVVAGAWVGILLIGVYIAGIETACQVKYLEREPYVVTAAKHDSATAVEKQNLLDWLRKHHQDAVAIYQFGSEVRLNDYYRQAYKQPIGSDYRLFRTKAEIVQAIERGELGDEDRAARDRTQTSATFLGQLRDDPVAGGLPDSSVEKTLLERFTTDRPQRDQDVDYMKKRLAWVHPARSGDSLRLPMEKYTAEGRFHRFAMRRQMHAEQCLYGQYPTAFHPHHGVYDTRLGSDALYEMQEAMEEQDAGYLGPPPYPLDANARHNGGRRVPTEEAYFPGPDDAPGGHVLEKQMTLRTAEEAAVAYRQYIQLILSSLEKDAHGEQKRETLQHFFALSLDQQHALAKIFSTRCDCDERLTVEEKDDLIDFLGDSDARETILADGDLETDGLHEQPALIATLLQKHQEHEEAIHLIETRALVRGEQDLLLTEEVHDFLHQLRRLGGLRNDQGVSEDQGILQIMENPIQYAIERRLLAEHRKTLQRQVATATSDREREKLLNNALTTQFRRFCALTDRDQEAILNEIALLRLFTPAVTMLESPWFYIGRLYSYSWLYAMAVVFGMLYLPITLGCVILGIAAARILRKRNELRELIASEDRRADQGQNVTLPATSGSIMRGRDDFLQRLRHLALRGWGTIAVVGRRGVGKTRVLREMLAKSTTVLEGERRSETTIGVWLSVPSHYSELEFVTSLRHSLAEEVEVRISRKLGVLPLVARRILERLKWAEVAAAVCLCCALGVMLSESVAPMYQAELKIAYAGPLILFSTGLLLLYFAISQMPPVNIGRWLTKRAMAAPGSTQGILLYQEAMECLNRQTDASLTGSLWPHLKLIAQAMLGYMCLMLVVGSAAFMIEDFTDNKNLPQMIVGFVASAGALTLLTVVPSIAIINWVRSAGNHEHKRDTTLTSEVALFRKFAESTVTRMPLVCDDERSGRIIVCLDELDKIIEPQQTRAFLRKMKGLFEIKGVFYFISLAEDARRTLALGSSMGKDEVDSSVDHIMNIAPLDLESTRQVVREYYASVKTISSTQSLRLDEFDVPGIVTDYIAVVSGGVARDSLRYVDRWAASLGFEENPGVSREMAWKYVQESTVREFDEFVESGILDWETSRGLDITSPVAVYNLLQKNARELEVGDRSGKVMDNFRALVRLLALSLTSDIVVAGHAEQAELFRHLKELVYHVPTESMQRLRSDAEMCFRTWTNAATESRAA